MARPDRTPRSTLSSTELGAAYGTAFSECRGEHEGVVMPP